MGVGQTYPISWQAAKKKKEKKKVQIFKILIRGEGRGGGGEVPKTSIHFGI